MKTMAIAIVVVSIVVLLNGCAKWGPSYKLGNESFDSGSAALQKQSEMHSELSNKITPVQNPIGGTALVLIPSDVEIQRNFIKYQGDPSKLSQEGSDFIISSVRNNCKFMADAIVKRHIFTSVSVVRHDGNPAQFPLGANDFLVFLDIDGWFIRGKAESKPLSVTPSGKMPTFPIFLDALYQQAKYLQAKDLHRG